MKEKKAGTEIEKLYTNFKLLQKNLKPLITAGIKQILCFDHKGLQSTMKDRSWNKSVRNTKRENKKVTCSTLSATTHTHTHKNPSLSQKVLGSLNNFNKLVHS